MCLTLVFPLCRCQSCCKMAHTIASPRAFFSDEEEAPVFESTAAECGSGIRKGLLSDFSVISPGEGNAHNVKVSSVGFYILFSKLPSLWPACHVSRQGSSLSCLVSGVCRWCRTKLLYAIEWLSDTVLLLWFHGFKAKCGTWLSALIWWSSFIHWDRTCLL